MTYCDIVEEKLSGYLDGELSQQQSQQLRIHLESCASCKDLHSELNNLKNAIKTIQCDGGEEAILEKIMNDLDAGKKQQWGWRLVIVGAVMLVGYAFIGFVFSSEINSFEKLAIGLLGLGGILLFLSVLRQRLIASKTDKYKDINL